MITKINILRLQSLRRGLPVPVNISNIWNFGSCLGLFLSMQIFTGLLLARHYKADVSLAFDRLINMRKDVAWGSILRQTHLNGASFYFLFLYFHIGRGVYYKSYSYRGPWVTGFIIIILSILVAFLGYVLPWGQISYWGATVITNLISAVPVVGDYLVRWIWGGFRVGSTTLNRFFMIHFCMPIFMVAVVIIHVFILHKVGSQNPSNILRKYNILRFHPYFIFKDGVFFLVVFLLLETLIFLNPYLLGDPENFVLANILNTPEHIVPEWYFLFAYAILRRIPMKGLGVIAIVSTLFIVTVPGLIVLVNSKTITFAGRGFRWVIQVLAWILVISLVVLTWLGGQTVAAPYLFARQIMCMRYLVSFTTLIALSS